MEVKGMREDLVKILKMLSEGKLNVEKSAELIDAMYKKEEKEIENMHKLQLFLILKNNKKGVILDEQFIFNTCKLKKEYAYIWVF